MRYLIAILVARLARFAVRIVRPGGGSALPGLILSKLAPSLLSEVLSGFKMGLVVVTGSAGKSTTTKMLVAIVRAHGLTVFTNPSTANIAQGFFSSIVERASLSGRINADVAILATAALTATEAVILNADDQNLIRLFVENESQLAEVSWFGVDQAVLLDSRHGQGIAPTYLPDLSRPVAISSVTGLQQLEALVSVASNQGTVALPNRGLHFAVDAIAALESARRFLKADFDADLANQTLSDLPPVFARGELVQIEGKSIEFILVQNPTSFQLNLDNLAGNLDRVMIAIGRDVHDPSWLWTVDFSNLSHVDVVSGFNAAEMALRLHYAEVPFDSVEDDLESAFASFMALGDPANGVRTVIFSADSMRRLRRQLGLTDPEDVGR